MKANYLKIKPWDDTLNHSVLIELVNKMNRYLNPKDPIEMNEEMLNLWLKDVTLSQNFLKFEDNENNIIAYVGIIKHITFKDSWIIAYALLPEYFESDLPRKLIEASLNLGKRLKIPELLIITRGSLSAPLDKELEDLGFKPIHYTWCMLLDDFNSFNIPNIPHGITIRKDKEINNYNTYTAVLDKAFQDSFKYEPITPKKNKQIMNNFQKLGDLEHLLAFDKNKLVGVCDLFIKLKYNNLGLISGLGILPHYQRRGIGSALLTSGVVSLHEKGCEEIILNVEANNENALNLYKKFGFQIQNHLTQKIYQVI